MFHKDGELSCLNYMMKVFYELLEKQPNGSQLPMIHCWTIVLIAKSNVLQKVAKGVLTFYCTSLVSVTLKKLQNLQLIGEFPLILL